MIGPYELNQIYTGDARALAEGIPDNSVDLIFTDPVYWQIEDYEWLAWLGERILAPGGNLIAQTCSEYRYAVETAMRKSGLFPMPLLAEVYPGAGFRMFKYKVMTGWKPYIWMSKGQRIGRWVFDRQSGGGVSKSTHKWEDTINFFLPYIERLTKPGAIVFDPFTGGGTIPAVCKMLDRRYLAFEIDPVTADKARERVFNTQPPLFVPEPVQSGLWGEA